MEEDTTGFVVCEVCLQPSHKTCENASELEEIASVLAVDFAITSFQKKNICEKCQETIKKFKTFKMQLMKSEDERSLVSDVEVKGECSVETEVCKLCKNNIDMAELQLVAYAIDEHNFQDLMQKHFPEIHVSLPDAQICKPCIQWLEDFKTFTSTLLFLRAKFSDMKCEITDNDIEDIKIKTEVNLKSEPSEFMDTESDALAETDSTIKIEESDMVDEDTRRTIKEEFQDVLSNHLKQKHTFDTESPIYLKTHEDPKENKMFKCTECTYQSKQSHALKVHWLTHKSPEEIEMFKCKICTYEAKSQRYLKWHMLVHSNPQEIKMFKCVECSFETKRKRCLRNHILIHRNKEDVKMFKCAECTFQTKHERSLKSHIVIHRDKQEAKMHKCSECTFETKHKASLRHHKLVHRNKEEVKMFKCPECTFETKHKGSLKTHSLVHKNWEDIKMLKYVKYTSTATCPHDSPQEIKMFKCTECTFQTKHHGSLEIHALIHGNPQEDPHKISLFKCTVCNFETKRLTNFRRHGLRHKTPQSILSKALRKGLETAESSQHTIDIENPICLQTLAERTYQSKYLYFLKDHLVTHKTLKETEMFECTICTRKFKLRRYLEAHMLVHSYPEEIKMFKCDECCFETKHERSLKRHILVHRSEEFKNDESAIH